MACKDYTPEKAACSEWCSEWEHGIVLKSPCWDWTMSLPRHLSIALQLSKVKITGSQGKTQHEVQPVESQIILIAKHQTFGTDPRGGAAYRWVICLLKPSLQAWYMNIHFQLNLYKPVWMHSKPIVLWLNLGYFIWGFFWFRFQKMMRQWKQ